MTATSSNIAGSALDSSSSGSPAPSRYDPLVIALIVLTFITGMIDAVSYLGLGRVFTANMTGNVVLLGFAAAGVPGLSITRSLTSLGGFLVGAAAGGKLASVMASSAQRRWLVSAALTEAALIFAAAVAAFGFDIDSGAPASRLYAIIVLTALAMGLRNATIRRVAVADVTTTVLTLTLTGLAADSSPASGTNPRLARRLLSVVAMFAGAAVGALLLQYGLAMPLAIAGASVLGTTAAYTRMPSSTENRSVTVTADRRQ